MKKKLFLSGDYTHPLFHPLKNVDQEIFRILGEDLILHSIQSISNPSKITNMQSLIALFSTTTIGSINPRQYTSRYSRSCTMSQAAVDSLLFITLNPVLTMKWHRCSAAH